MEKCATFFLWGVNVSLTSRCVHQQRDIWKTESCCTRLSLFFHNFFSDYLQVQVEDISIFPLEILPWWHSSLFLMSGGKDCVKLWLLNPKWAQMSSLFPVGSFCSILFQVCSLQSALLCAEAFWGFFFCSTVWCKWKNRKCFAPLLSQKSKKRRKTHLPSCCVQELLVHR